MELLCRVAENMFWLNRYVERAISIIRVVDVTAHLELDAGDAEDREVDFWTPLLGPALDAAQHHDAPQPSPQDVRYYLAFDPDNPSSLVSCVRAARNAARQVRDSISSEMWERINTSFLELIKSQRVGELEDDLHGFYRQVRDGLLLIQGLADATVAHDEAWQFLELGKYLERADNVSRLLRLQGHMLTTARRPSDAGDETVRWLAVLRSAGSAEAYSRYYSLRVEPTRVLEFLLLNPTFPQSVRYSLGSAWSALESIAQATDEGSAPPVRALGMLQARLEHASVDEVLEHGLEEFLGGIHSGVEPHHARVFPLRRGTGTARGGGARGADHGGAPTIMRIAVTHVTRMEFGTEVSESVMDARLGPRDDAHQHVQSFRVRLEPAGHVRRYEDGFGNIAHLMTSLRPHTFLQVSAESQVETFLSDPFQLPTARPQPLDAVELVDHLDPSPLIPRTAVVEEMTAQFRSDDVFDSVRRMAEFIYRGFEYRQNVTDVTTSIEHVVEGRQGVCQDFAHLLIGMCRAVGIPARYVSGYILARSTRADDHGPSRGAGASHACAEAFTPDEQPGGRRALRQSRDRPRLPGCAADPRHIPRHRRRPVDGRGQHPRAGLTDTAGMRAPGVFTVLVRRAPPCTPCASGLHPWCATR